MTTPEIRTIPMPYGWLAAIGCGSTSVRATGRTRDEAIAALLEAVRPDAPRLVDERKAGQVEARELEY